MRNSHAEGADALYALGYAYEKMGNAAEARRNYSAAVMVNKGHEKARRRLLTLDETA